MKVFVVQDKKISFAKYHPIFIFIACYLFVPSDFVVVIFSFILKYSLVIIAVEEASLAAHDSGKKKKKIRESETNEVSLRKAND